MKTLVLIFIIGCFSATTGFAENRIQTWDTREITSIQVEIAKPTSETLSYTYTKRDDMDSIFSYLNGINFQELNENNLPEEDPEEYSSAKIVCIGQRDQVYLHRKTASIGKTSFIIEPTVYESFVVLINELNR